MWNSLIQMLYQLAQEGSELPPHTIKIYVWLCLSLALNAAMLLCWVMGVLHRFAQRVRRLFRVNRREIVVQVQRTPARTMEQAEERRQKKKQPEVCTPDGIPTEQDAPFPVKTKREKPVASRSTEPVPKRARWPPVAPKVPKLKKRKAARGCTAMYTPRFFAQMPNLNNKEEML